MKTVGTRELKQNPHTVIQRVLETGDEFDITNYGRPTGARIVPDRPAPRRWISGASLTQISPLSPQQAAAWRQDIEESVDDDVADPWERA
jgi:antitoxin (DNA-binding transcriptional repressor) of toxin-antitoxin stability system